MDSDCPRSPLIVEAEHNKRFTMKLTEQSEIKLETGCRSSAGRRQRRMSQASWWFGQMRRAVDKACPGESSPERRVEQRVMSL